MSPVALRNIALLIAACIGIGVAASFDFPSDPITPYLVVAGLLLALKLNLEYALGLTMHAPRFLATPPERSKRRRALLATWALVPLLIYAAVA